MKWFEHFLNGLLGLGSMVADFMGSRSAIVAVFVPVLALPLFAMKVLPGAVEGVNEYMVGLKAEVSAQAGRDVISMAENLQTTEVGLPSGLDLIMFLNTYVPLSEMFVMASFTWGLWLSVKAYRIMKSWLPTVSGA